jgi:26S proteasome regulatory subunit N3
LILYEYIAALQNKSIVNSRECTARSILSLVLVKKVEFESPRTLPNDVSFATRAPVVMTKMIAVSLRSHLNCSIFFQPKDIKMTEDTKMEESDSPDKEQKVEIRHEIPSTFLFPPLEAAARRLERALGGGQREKELVLHTHANPTKVVRRWLGTASGAAGNASFTDIASAATALLDPTSSCAAGRELLVAVKDSSMNVDKNDAIRNTNYLTGSSERAVEGWLLSLSIRLLFKDKKLAEAYDLAQKSIYVVLGHLELAATKMTSLSRASSSSLVSSSSLFPLLARLYRYRSLVAEEINDAAMITALRQDVLKAHNLACLRRDVDSQATLLNLLLRDLLSHSQSKSFMVLRNVQRQQFANPPSLVSHSVEQAHKLLSNSTFPDSASNNQLCRYLYHSGRIQSLRLEYTKAFSNLSQCLRKAPTNVGLGFRIAAQRLSVIVQLLMGEIPERRVFFAKGMQTELSPYLAITQAVRRGDLAIFNKVVSEHAARLRQDDTYTLISRLAHQVVKAGLRKLHVSYSRLSLKDVTDRLSLPSDTSAEFVVAKAVRDGVLDATIHHEEGYVQSHDLVDVYSTKEPTEAFHRRIAYCLTTHNDAIRGMRYPPDEYKKQLEASRGNRRKRSEDKTDEEKAQELEDELDDEY